MKRILSVVMVTGLVLVLFAGCCKKQEKEIANLKAQVTQLQNDNSAIKAEADKVKAELEAKVNALQSENSKLQAENADLKKKIEDLQKPARKTTKKKK